MSDHERLAEALDQIEMIKRSIQRYYPQDVDLQYPFAVITNLVEHVRTETEIRINREWLQRTGVLQEGNRPAPQPT